MSTLEEMSDFLAKLPADARAVLIAQDSPLSSALRTDSLTLASDSPNWPQAIWDAMVEIGNGDAYDPEEDWPDDTTLIT